MGLYQRLRRITVGNIENFLSTVEDPEIILPQLIREMEDQLRQASAQEAEALAATRRQEIVVKRLQTKIAELDKGARLALKQDDHNTATQAVGSQIDLEKQLEAAEKDITMLQASLDLAVASREQIYTQLHELQAKKHELLTRAKVAKTRKNVQQTINGSASSSGSILDAVARLETQIEQDEAELEIQSMLVNDARIHPQLANRISQLEKESKIEERLAALRESESINVNN